MTQVRNWVSPSYFGLVPGEDSEALATAIEGCVKYKLDKDYVGILVEQAPLVKQFGVDAVPEIILVEILRSLNWDLGYSVLLSEDEKGPFGEALSRCLERMADKGKDENKDDKKSESVQAEDDVDKEVVEASSMTSEDVHGGNEATRSILGSPSAASAGVCSNENQEDTDNSSDNKDDKEEDKNHHGGKNQKASIDLESLLTALTPEEQNRAKIIKAALNDLCQMVHGKNQKGGQARLGCPCDCQAFPLPPAQQDS